MLGGEMKGLWGRFPVMYMMAQRGAYEVFFTGRMVGLHTSISFYKYI